MAQLDPATYTVVWIAPLEIEAICALHMLDHRHHGHFSLSRGDEYVFHAGDMCGYNVVIATLPAGQEYGTGSAAALAAQVKKFFPNLWFGLLVGVAAGLPNLSKPKPRDIRLGDVLVALPEGEKSAVVAYDLGKETGKDGFQLLRCGHVLAFTEAVVRSAIGSIKIFAPNDAEHFLPFYDNIKDKEHADGTFLDPGQAKDELYETDEHGVERLVERDERPPSRRTRVWYGPIGSGEKLVKDALIRNKLRDKYNIIGLEMEAAGTMNRIPVGVIRGVCDYGDERKNKEWQPYAAAMAAAYAKAVLPQIGPQNPGQQAPAQEATRSGIAEEIRIFHHIPFAENKRFVGRETTMNALKRQLGFEYVDEEHIQSPIEAEGHHRVAIVGLGGIGKTQVALGLAHWVKAHKQDVSVVWIPGYSMESFEKTCTELIEKLGIQQTQDQDPKTCILRYLTSKTTRKWLLIIDNVDDMDVLVGSSEEQAGIINFLPQSENVRILVTTRFQEVAVTIAGTDVSELLQMDRVDAESLLKNSLIRKDQLQDIRSTTELLDALMDFPLAIAQAAAYINYKKTTISKYLERFKKTDEETIKLLSREFHSSSHYKRAQGAIATTWIISFNQISEADPHAAQLLRFISWIEPKDIPESILPQPGSEYDREEAIGTLCGYGFLSQHQESDMFDMHILVHLALQVWLKARGADEEAISDAVEHLESIFPSDDWHNRYVWRQYMPHALKVYQASKSNPYMYIFNLIYRVGMCLRVDYRIKESIQILGDVVVIGREILPENHRRLLLLEYGLALSYLYNGQSQEAIRLLEHIIAIETAEDHPDRLASQHALSLSYQQNGQTQEAIQLLEHIIAIEIAEDHPDRLASQHALSLSYQQNGQTQEAIQLLEKITEIQKETLAEDHPNRLTSQYDLALSYQQNGQTQEAIQLLENIIEIQKETLVENHPDQLAAQYELALSYQQHGQTQEAIALLEHITEVEEKTTLI